MHRVPPTDIPEDEVIESKKFREARRAKLSKFAFEKSTTITQVKKIYVLNSTWIQQPTWKELVRQLCGIESRKYAQCRKLEYKGYCLPLKFKVQECMEDRLCKVDHFLWILHCGESKNNRKRLSDRCRQLTRQINRCFLNYYYELLIGRDIEGKPLDNSPWKLTGEYKKPVKKRWTDVVETSYDCENCTEPVYPKRKKGPPYKF